MPLINEKLKSTDKEFDSIPDILDPKLAEKLNSIIDQHIGNRRWHIKMYIADDGTGNLRIVSFDDSYSQSYNDNQIFEAYEGDLSREELLDSIHKWKKIIYWHWQERYPIIAVGYETIDGEDFSLYQRRLTKCDMSRWKDTMIFGEFRKNNRTSVDSVKDDKTKIRDNFYSSNSNTMTQQRLEEEDKETDPLPSDEISVVFSEIYDLWMNYVRRRFSLSNETDIPEHFDLNGSRMKTVKIINHFDKKLLKIKEHRAADAGNITNYRSDFSELYQSYQFMKKNIVVPSTVPDKEFVENWERFNEKMGLFVELLREHNSVML